MFSVLLFSWPAVGGLSPLSPFKKKFDIIFEPANGQTGNGLNPKSIAGQSLFYNSCQRLVVSRLSVGQNIIDGIKGFIACL